MAGYCTVLSTVYTKHSAAVQAVHPIVWQRCYQCCLVIAATITSLTLLTLTTGAGVTRGNINQSSSLTDRQWPGWLVSPCLSWTETLDCEEWGLLTFDLNCASQLLSSQPRAWRSIQPELVTPNDSCWQQSRFQLFVIPGSNVWNSSYWAICGWVMVSDCTNNGWTNWFNAE